MAVSDGQVANQTTFNTSYMDRQVDTDTVGQVGLKNTAPASIANITNLQQFAQEMADALGYTGEGDTTRKTYSDTTIVANGDSRKVAVGKLSAAMNESGTPKVLTSVTTLSDGQTWKGALNIVGDSNISVTGSNLSKTVTVSWVGKPRTLIENVTIPNNTASPTVLAATKNTVNLAFEVDISIIRGTNWIAGRIRVIDNGDGTASFVPSYNEVGDCGITWSATIENLAGFVSICLKYTTTNTGTDAFTSYEYNSYKIPT